MGWVGHLEVLSRDCSDCDKIVVADFAGNTVRTTERTAAAEPGGRDRERNPEPASLACHVGHSTEAHHEIIRALVPAPRCEGSMQNRHDATA